MNRIKTALTYLLIITITFACFTAGALWFLLHHPFVDFSKLERPREARSTLVFAQDGSVLAQFVRNKHDVVSFEHLPKHLVDAFCAIEDTQFFNHWGICPRSIVRSALKNLYKGRVVQGASTITQQVVKLNFLTYERTFSRKMQEVLLALQLERHMTKQQIFQIYVNSIYYGRGIYGVRAAAHYFWGKRVEDLTLEECATLAAVAKSALHYSPLNSSRKCRQRRDLVLRCMRTNRYITKDECKKAQAVALELRQVEPGNSMRMYVTEWIRQWLEKELGRDAVYHKGLRVQTTIDPVIQEKAEQSFVRNMQKLRTTFGAQLDGALLSCEPTTGKIRACIGGYNFNQSQFNRAFQAVRPTGSSFKPVLYVAALQAGLTLDQVFIDEPLEIQLSHEKTWVPRNWNGQFQGPMILQHALSSSNNIVAIKVFQEIGVRTVMSWARKFGFSRDCASYPSSALGVLETSVLENCAAFNVFANDGQLVHPFLVEWVKDEWGTKIWHHRPEKKAVLDLAINSHMLNALLLRARLYENDLAKFSSDVVGKTGSTNGASTVWFVGSSPELTTAVYVGHDDNKKLGRYAFASSTAYPIWRDLYASLPCEKKHFYLDPMLKRVKIDWRTGQEVSNDGLFTEVVLR